MPINFDDYPVTPFNFGRKGKVITPSDSEDLPYPVKGVVALSAGNLSIVPLDNPNGEPMNFVGVYVGFSPPFIVRRVLATGTTAVVASVD